MALFTEQFKEESQKRVERYVNDSGYTDEFDIIRWIELNRKAHIVEAMREEAQWSEIVISKLTPKQVKECDCVFIRENGKQHKLFSRIVDEILFQYWCDEVIFLRDEIADVLASQDSEPDSRDADYNALRNDNLRGDF